MFASLGYCFNSTIYVVVPVKEYEEKIKYALNVMGCRFLPYWLGTYIFDFLVFFVTIPLIAILIFALTPKIIYDYSG